MTHILDRFGNDLTADREQAAALYSAMLRQATASQERWEALERQCQTDESPDAIAAAAAAEVSHRAVMALVDDYRTRAIDAEVREVETGGTSATLTLGSWD